MFWDVTSFWTLGEVGKKVNSGGPLDEFPLPEQLSTAYEDKFPLLIQSDATVKKIALLLKTWVIEFRDSYEAPTTDAATRSASEGTATKKGRTFALNTEDMQKRKNDVKARTTLLLALSDEHQLRFSKYKTAQELWAAILKTFGGNETTKKTKKNLLQAIVSHLQFMDIEIEQDDLNQKFLTSLAPEWLMHTIVWRNKSDLDTMSLDDLYNHLKVYESEVQKKTESNSQNMAFISSAKNNSEKEDVNTASIPTASTNVSPDSVYIGAVSIRTNVAGFDKSKVEFFNCHKIGHFTREYRAPKNQDRGRRDNYRQGSKVKEQAPKALMAIDGVGWDWSFMANEEEDHALVADEEAPIEFTLMAKTSAESEACYNCGGVDHLSYNCGKWVDHGRSWAKNNNTHKSNISYLSDYEPFYGGYVSFGQGGCKITGKGTIKTDKIKFENVYFVKDLKDETSGILRNFITDIENLKELRVKIIRCDNGGEFRNKEMNDFFSRKEAARTILADAKLPVTFWAEAVNTACYVQNRVLVNKSQNKTPYELFNGRTPAIGFLKPFGCHVMILNTLDNLGKFEAKGDEGYFIGYSMSSKAFKVFNKRTKRVEENLHVDFLENKPIEKGAGPNWLFDIDSLTNSMNYVPVVVAGINSTKFLGTKEAACQDVKKDVSSLRYIVLSNWFHETHLESSSSNAQDTCKVDASKSSGNFNPTATLTNPPDDHMETLVVETPIPTVSSPVLTVCLNDSLEPSIYRMDAKSAFLYGTIDEEVLLEPEFEALMHEKFQMSAMGELNFFLGLQVLQKEDGIFLSQDKYVGDILKKFVYSNVRSSNTPIHKENPWGKDGTGKDVDLHLYRSMIGSLMYLTASRPDIMFDVCACARHQVTPKECHLYAVKRIFRYLKGHPKLGLWYPKESPFDLVAYSDSDYGGATQDHKSTTGGSASGCGQVLGIQNQLVDYGSSMPCAALSKEISSSILLLQYTRRDRIAQSSALPPVADEPASPIGDDKVATATVSIPTGSGVVSIASPSIPTASPIFTSATKSTPYTRRKGKETMFESETPKKKKVQEQIDVQLARELEEEMARDAQRMNELIAQDAEIARIHAEEELQMLIDGLDINNETLTKPLCKNSQIPDSAKKALLKEATKRVLYVSAQESCRLGGSITRYQFFVDLLKHFDWEDLNQLSALVKETLNIKPATRSDEFPLPEQLPTAYEDKFLLLIQSDATVKKIALLLKTGCINHLDIQSSRSYLREDQVVSELEMDQQNPTPSKILILDTGKFEQWQFRIQQLLQHKQYALWEVIEFGDSYEAPTTDAATGSASEGTATKKGRIVALTTEDIQKRKNDVKARTTLLLALPDEHQLRFKGSENLEQTFNRLQDIVSHLQFIDIEIEQDDLNQKFLTSLAPEWLMHTIVWRKRSDLDTMSLDDIYNHLKGSRDTACAYIASQSSGSQIKFEDITQIDEDDMEEMDIKWNMALLSIRADRFWKKTGKKISIQGTDLAGFDKSKVECFNCHKMGHFARECRAHRSQDRGRRDNYRQGSKVKDQALKALMAIDEVGWDWSFMANEEEDHALVADEEAHIEFVLMAKTSAESETGLPEFADDIITDYTRPSPNVESNPNDLQNSSSFASENGESTGGILSKPEIKFVRPADSPTVVNTDKKETTRKSIVKYAELYKKPSKKSTVRGTKETGTI
nr:hypothetical protein [Tanacetum cinerariifolium]